MKTTTWWFSRWDVKHHGMSFETITDQRSGLKPIFQFTVERPWAGNGSMFVNADLNREEAFELMEGLRAALFDTVEDREDTSQFEGKAGE